MARPPDDTAGFHSEPLVVETEAEFESLVHRTEVVLVDCYADWCGPCRQMDPVIDQLASETAAAVLKVDVDQHPDIAAQYNVRSIPTYIVMADGETQTRYVGKQPKSELEHALVTVV